MTLLACLQRLEKIVAKAAGTLTLVLGAIS